MPHRVEPSVSEVDVFQIASHLGPGLGRVYPRARIKGTSPVPVVLQVQIMLAKYTKVGGPRARASQGPNNRQWRIMIEDCSFT